MEHFQHTMSRKAIELGITETDAEFHKEAYNGWKVVCINRHKQNECNSLQTWIDEKYKEPAEAESGT